MEKGKEEKNNNNYVVVVVVVVVIMMQLHNLCASLITTVHKNEFEL